ncbi:MAG TPA: helix-turn-helix domain-containing protein [Chloroflexota bacterium]|jgi:DNA-binding transcriptional ArsR family regulator|nr:helix-turn-helix domain-containing protein [Chloroflexota bacterium]
MAPGNAGTNDEPDRVARLEQQMAAVLHRLGALGVEPAELGLGTSLGGGRREEANVQGTLAISGSIRLGERRFMIQHRGNLSEALETEPEVVARVFAALGSPFRVRLLCALLEGPRTSHELQTELDVGPVGQLYHHLKELLAAGLIAQRRRGVYAIREEIVMPICMAFVVAPRLASAQGVAPQLAEEQDKEEDRRGE